MNFIDIVKQRVSVRSYDSQRPLAQTTLNNILEAGRLAPSATNAQPWEFWLISSPEMLRKLHNCYKKDWFARAPHVLVVVGNKDVAWSRAVDNYNSIETDCAIAMDHIILAATAEGVGTCWIANFDPVCVKEALDLESNQVVFAMTPLGYPEKDFSPQEKRRKAFSEVVKFK